jgi:hypothetical protein
MSREVIRDSLTETAAKRTKFAGPNNKGNKGSIIINISSTPALE